MAREGDKDGGVRSTLPLETKFTLEDNAKMIQRVTRPPKDLSLPKMPDFKFTDEQVTALADYIETLK